MAPDLPSRAIAEYLTVLDDTAFGVATEVTPKFISPAARWTGVHGGPVFFAYSTNCLIDLDHAVIVDVEATTAARLRGPCGAHDEFLLAATAQNLRKLAKLIPMPEPMAVS